MGNQHATNDQIKRGIRMIKISEFLKWHPLPNNHPTYEVTIPTNNPEISTEFYFFTSHYGQFEVPLLVYMSDLYEFLARLDTSPITDKDKEDILRFIWNNITSYSKKLHILNVIGTERKLELLNVPDYDRIARYIYSYKSIPLRNWFFANEHAGLNEGFKEFLEVHGKNAWNDYVKGQKLFDL